MLINKKPIVLITTPIYYCNSELHLGHLYSSFYSDFLSRFYENEGYKVYFITGADQYGQKIFNKAKQENLKPQDFVNLQTEKILKLWKEVDLNFTHFVKTTDEKHKKFVKNLFEKFLQNNEVILKDYKGKYCVSCENFISEKVKDNKCPVCKLKLINLVEKNYFISLNKKNIDDLKILIKNQKDKNSEIKFLNQLDEYLSNEKVNFSISRNKLDWGILLSEKENQKAYVWFDALLSYISPLTFDEINEIWKNKNSKIIHVLGKEIMKFFLIYWPILLKKQNFKNPDNFLIHGWILNKDTKMSKSLGNVISASDFLKRYDSDVSRLFLAKLMNPQLDIDFNINSFDEFYNSYIVKNLSNFHFRLLNMIQKFKINFNDLENIKFKFKNKIEEEQKIIKKYIQEFKINFNNFKIAKSFNEIFKLLDYGNKKITIEEPWNLYKKNKNNYLEFVLYILLIILKIVSDLLLSFAPNIAKRIKNDLLDIKNINDIYNIELEFNNKFTVKLIQHLYDKK